MKLGVEEIIQSVKSLPHEPGDLSLIPQNLHENARYVLIILATGQEETGRSLRFTSSQSSLIGKLQTNKEIEFLRISPRIILWLTHTHTHTTHTHIQHTHTTIYTHIPHTLHTYTHITHIPHTTHSHTHIHTHITHTPHTYTHT